MLKTVSASSKCLVNISDGHACIPAGVGKPDNYPVRIMFEIRVKGFGGGGGVAFGHSVESITQTDVLGAFTGSRRGLLCQRPITSHGGGRQQWVLSGEMYQ